MLSSGNGENGHAEVRVYWDAATGECRRTRRRRPCDYVRRVAGTTDYDGVHSRGNSSPPSWRFAAWVRSISRRAILLGRPSGAFEDKARLAEHDTVARGLGEPR